MKSEVINPFNSFIETRYTLTVQEFLDALDKNGYPWAKETFYSNGASCAIGQAGRNLGLDPLLDYNAFWKLADVLNIDGETDIMHFNDMGAESYDDVVVYAHNHLDKYADKEITFVGKRLRHGN